MGFAQAPGLAMQRAHASIVPGNEGGRTLGRASEQLTDNAEEHNVESEVVHLQVDDGHRDTGTHYHEEYHDGQTRVEHLQNTEVRDED